MNLLPDSEMSATDEATERLYRGLTWEAERPLPGKRLASGLLIHVFLLCPWLISVPRSTAAEPAAPRHVAIPIFTAPPRVAASPANPSPFPAVGPLSVAPEPALVANVSVDLTTVQLVLSDDVTGQLPEVVRMHAGELALLDKDDQQIARYTLSPPDWELREGIRDVSRKLRFVMYPPSNWPVFREAAGRVDLSRYHAAALFDRAFGRCLQEEIRKHAISKASDSGGRVRTARLAFAAHRPCGIEILEVSLAGNASH